MLTVKDLQKSQKGPWTYTLLEGSALESVEHLTLEISQPRMVKIRYGKCFMDVFQRKSLLIWWVKVWEKYLAWRPKTVKEPRSGWPESKMFLTDATVVLELIPISGKGMDHVELRGID